MTDDFTALEGAAVAALRVSPVADLAAAFEAVDVAGSRGVRLRKIPFPAQVNLRIDASHELASRRIGAALGAELPTVPNTVAQVAGGYVLWLGPDEWLIVSPSGDAASIEGALRSALAGAQMQDAGGSVVNISAARAVFELSGPSARGVLEKGCALDLHPSAFRPGRCAQTLVSRVEVILHQTTDTTYRLFVRSSFARYLALWLLDAMDEYRHPALEELA